MSEGESRHPLQARARMVVPVAIAVGLLGGAAAPRARLFFLVTAAAIAILWVASRIFARVLVVGEGGYRVVRRGEVVLSVRWEEVQRARGVPAEQAMYLDTGQAARNLLLPTRHGYGFRFADQEALYVRIAKALGDRLEIVEALVPPEPPTEKR